MSRREDHITPPCPPPSSQTNSPSPRIPGPSHKRSTSRAAGPLPRCRHDSLPVFSDSSNPHQKKEEEKEEKEEEEEEEEE